MAVNSYKQDEQLKKLTGRSKRQIIGRLFSYLAAYRKRIAVVLALIGCGVAVGLIDPMLIRHAVDVCIPDKDMKGILTVSAAAAVLNLILFLSVRKRMLIMAEVCNDVLITIREQLYTHIQSLGLRFFDSLPHGKILSRVIGDVNSLRDVLNNFVTTLIPALITIIATAVIMFSANPGLAAAALAATPVMAAGTMFIQKRAHPRWRAFRQKASNLNAFIHEDLAGIRVVQSFAAEGETEAELDTLMGEHRGAFLSAVKYADAFYPFVDIAWTIGGILLYWAGIIMLSDENITVGTFMSFSIYLGMFWEPIQNLASFYNQLTTNLAAAERIFEMIDLEPDITDSENAAAAPEFRGEVEFRDVCFSYDDDKTPMLRVKDDDGSAITVNVEHSEAQGHQVLSNVSFRTAPGETIALVGPTGAGKSTIANLIARFYEVQSGSVMIDGTDIRGYTLETLHSRMAIMTQDSFLFSGPIKENIRYGRLDATDEEVIEAAKAVHADEFIMKLKDGYDTELTEYGEGLSAGQKQLIALARTMLADPRILILDEATSSIDTRTELKVQAGIERLLSGRTSFVIAHRLSTIRNADRIFVVDGGIIAEQGSHSQLMEKKGLYYRMNVAQDA
ncbi:MAG: ABC transporter ATP-binding protein [Oscillospiraceae bacterium]|nr:ABC transporter ATP-binding protein [Oscillospiraceae bacterium]